MISVGSPSGLSKKKEKGLGGVLRVDGKIDPARGKRGAERKVAALDDCFRRAMLEIVCHFVLLRPGFGGSLTFSRLTK